MNILSIETSCDETAISIISTDSTNVGSPNFKVLCDLVVSQIAIHAPYGGVFPALAKREHAKNICPLMQQALKEVGMCTAGSHDTSKETMQEIKVLLEREPELFENIKNFTENYSRPNIDMIMVTYGPGLTPALWVGVNFARTLSLLWSIPLLPVNHMEGHVSSILLKDTYAKEEQALMPLEGFSFPMIALLISGGHTQIILVKDWCDYEILGETIDDAVGEAFDKTARMLGMEYPGGPKVSKAALQGQENDLIKLPRPMLHSGDYRFSFSGLKTAVRYLVEKLKDTDNYNDQTINDVAWEFEHAVTEVLIKKTSQAIEEYGAHGLIIAGGVSANKYISKSFRELLETKYNIPLYLPEKHMCGDNSLMIATAGFINYWKKGERVFTPQDEIIAVGNLKL